MEWVTLKGETPDVSAMHVGYIGGKDVAFIIEHNDKMPNCQISIKNVEHPAISGIDRAKSYCNQQQFKKRTV